MNNDGGTCIYLCRRAHALAHNQFQARAWRLFSIRRHEIALRIADRVKQQVRVAK